MTDNVQTVCLFCEQPLEGGSLDKEAIHEYSDQPCPTCGAHLDIGGYIFVSISNRSEPPDRIKRTGYTWLVDEEEVKEALPTGHRILQKPPGNRRIIFIRTNEAKVFGLIDEQEAEQIESNNGSDKTTEES